MKSFKKNSRIEKKVLQIALELAKKGEGALFVIGTEIKYDLLLKQKMEPFNIFDNGADKILKSIAMIDGAVIIDKKGNVVAYGALIKGAKPFLGYGTRHAAALTASKGRKIVILCSEEERKVKIFKDGKLIMQLDALQKNIEKDIPRITSFLESLGAGFVGTVGVSVLAPTLGLTLIPGVIVFGASYFALKSMLNFLHQKS